MAAFGRGHMGSASVVNWCYKRDLDESQEQASWCVKVMEEVRCADLEYTAIF